MVERGCIDTCVDIISVHNENSDIVSLALNLLASFYYTDKGLVFLFLAAGIPGRIVSSYHSTWKSAY